MNRLLTLTTGLLLLAGCAVGPDYKKPEIASPPAWTVDMQKAQETANTAWWEQFKDPEPHESGKIMVCGHTAQKSGRPCSVGHAVCIDTWAHGRGWLTCLDVGSGMYWQANQQGETRKGWLEDSD